MGHADATVAVGHADDSVAVGHADDSVADGHDAARISKLRCRTFYKESRESGCSDGYANCDLGRQTALMRHATIRTIFILAGWISLLLGLIG
ncbi:MAG: hypothetical protein O7A69_07570, partial [SAR324 cluster bacterium]|nr:hypothetical protein [SAR324 cluster bacterium]